ncbi:hypothetical protein ATCC90586_000490 [Pythium insidiosum]|nr:hypothetical protein ATCC90586_000490 [Pythium insidiosum]
MEARIPGFVSTTVLTSADGLFGENTEEKRVAAAPAPRAEDAADFKPLYERLQEMKDQKDREWKEKNNPFAPPKALDEEEVSFIRELEERQATQDQQRKARQQEDLAEFILARESAKTVPKGSSAAASGPSLIDVAAKRLARGDIKPAAAPSVVVKAKRKAPIKSKGDDSRIDKKLKKPEEPSKPGVATTKAQAKAALVAYGSDSDNSDSD